MMEGKKAQYFVWCFIAVLFVSVAAGTEKFDSSIFSGMKARSIGPAGMSGRIADIEAVVSNPNIIYVGSATGGLWKSTNGGTTWKPLFDKQPVSSIGSIAVFQKNPNIVWVGTGEGNPRNSVGVGNGVFRSIDGGNTWKFIGLENTEKIHRIILHPDNPEVAYAAALGTTWGENPERGVYKTTDGGKTWNKILYVDEKTGCCDLVMDPSNPNKLFAAMWQHRRWPWFFKSGGPGSGLYVTYDGGENWKKIKPEDGIPKGDLGRIGIAIAQNNPDVVYALIEAKKSCLCRSSDGGRSWKIVNNKNNVNGRPFYYADLRVDPENENRVYSLQTRLLVSEDGGKTFNSIRSPIHSDHHALWINPDDGSLLIDGSDGGVSISRDRGKTWRFIDNIPVGQFYHINIDMMIPYNIYGGMQDNGSWRGPSSVWENGGIRNYHWNEVGFGDGFATLCDPTDPNIGYAMSQQGYLIRFNLTTGERKDIRPPSPADTIELRFNWNAAIAIDPFDPNTIYYGSQFVHMSTDKGDNWIIISPDLTTNDPDKQKQKESGGLTLDVTGAENHTTIITIAPSPLERGVIWVGTDDGNVQITRDGGKSWQNVVKNIPDLPPNTWCPHIEASKFDASVAYAVFDDHRRSNWKTYVYKTEDYGRHWKSLTKNDPTKQTKSSIDRWGFAHTIEQDPVDKDLLYLGTEFGLYISFDDGENWMKWTHGLPTVPVRALIVHPRDHDLVIGTHGRAAFILDNIDPLREISEDIIKKRLHLFKTPPAYLHRIKQVDGYHFPADAIYEGENKPYGAMLTYYINPDIIKEDKKESNKKVAIEIFDKDSNLVRKMKGPMKKGINRVYWNLKRDGFKMPIMNEMYREYAPSGPEIVPGRYLVKVKIGEDCVWGSIKVLPDPRENIPIKDRVEKYETLVRIGKDIEIIAEAVNRIIKTNKAIDIVLNGVKSKKDSTSKPLAEAGMKLKKKLASVGRLFVDMPGGKQGISGEDNVSRKFWYVNNSLSSSYDKPTSSQMTYLKYAEKELKNVLEKFNRLFDIDVKEFHKKVEESGFTLFGNFKPLTMQ